MTDPQVLPGREGYPATVETLIIGAGACGMVAALAAREAGQEVLVLERDAVPSGSTALSAGLIPAAGTKLQRAAGITDDPARFAADIQAKAQGQNDPAHVNLMARAAAPVIDWLTQSHGLPFSLVDDFDYPGHSCRRMHGLPTRAGQELIDALRTRAEALGIDILCNAPVTALHAKGRQITGVTLTRGGRMEEIGCDRLILACNGFGGNRAMVARRMPEIETALWFGHSGNQGEAVIWGQALGARTGALGAYQGHGNVAHPHGILITWAVITEGGIQVNAAGQRFWNEAQGYSEAARAVLSQPGGVAYAIFDTRIAQIARQFADFQVAERQGAVKTADTPAALARALCLPDNALSATLNALPKSETDRFGRYFGPTPLTPPFCGVKVTGALFHTQGGLCVNARTQVLHTDGAPFPNLHAAGGAACGVSGQGDTGYLSGNGLLSAVTLGYLAGKGGKDGGLA